MGSLTKALLPTSLFVLAGALGYFAYQIKLIGNKLDAVVPLLPVVLEQSKAWQADYHQTLVLLQQQTPRAIDQWQNSNQLLVQNLPKVLDESAAIRQLVNEQMPPLLDETQAWREALPSVLKETEQVRKSIPPILTESAALRRDIPQIITQADELVEQAGEAGRKASQGAVAGVLRLPLDILLGAGDFLLGDKKLSQSEVAAMTLAGEKLLSDNPNVGDTQSFKADTGFEGTLKIKGRFDDHCWLIEASAGHDAETPQKAEIIACADDQGQWRYNIKD